MLSQMQEVRRGYKKGVGIAAPQVGVLRRAVAVAKRAREIAQEQEEEHSLNEEKPVQKAVEEFAGGKIKVGHVSQISE